MAELLPCPFCGRQAELRYTEEGFAYIVCANDGCYVRTENTQSGFRGESMKIFYNIQAILICILTLGFIDVKVKYSDGTKFEWIGWITRLINR